MSTFPLVGFSSAFDWLQCFPANKRAQAQGAPLDEKISLHRGCCSNKKLSKHYLSVVPFFLRLLRVPATAAKHGTGHGPFNAMHVAKGFILSFQMIIMTAVAHPKSKSPTLGQIIQVLCQDKSEVHRSDRWPHSFREKLNETYRRVCNPAERGRCLSLTLLLLD